VCGGSGTCLSLRQLVSVATGGGVPLGASRPAVQTFSCSLTAGSLTFTSRWATSQALAWDAHPSELELAISNLATVGAVRVRATPLFFSGAYTIPTHICSGTSAAPFVMEITFLHDAGVVPPLVAANVGTANGVGDFEVTVVEAGSLPSYGADPLSTSTWDADMVHGCHCDGFPEWNSTSLQGDRGLLVGHACGLRTCPSGPDPFGGAVSSLEEQSILCTASGGVFSLSFRGVSTPPLDFDVTVAELAGALEDLASIGLVTVTQQGSGADARVCGWTDGAPRETRIRFRTELGDVPLLVGDAHFLMGPNLGTTPAQLTIREVAPGRATVRECSGQGVCDRSTGLCSCAASWLSSNGEGDLGGRGDCGARRGATSTQQP
jgi:hypothetical protein